MNRSGRRGFIERNHAGVYADMRAQAANAPGELSEWSAYMFDVMLCGCAPTPLHRHDGGLIS